MKWINDKNNPIFEILPKILIRDYCINDKCIRYYRDFNWIWGTLALFTAFLSILILYYFDEKIYYVTIISLLSNLAIWPIIYSCIYKKCIGIINYMKEEIVSDPRKNNEGTVSIDTISEEYSNNLELKTWYTKLTYIAFFCFILFFVFFKIPPLFNTSWLNTFSKILFVIDTAVGAFGAAGLLSTILCIDRLIRNNNIYKTYQHPKYAGYIRIIKDFISFTSYTIIGIYITIWIAIWGVSIDYTDSLLLFIMSCIGLFPLGYTVYNLFIQRNITNIAKRRELQIFENNKLRALHFKILEVDYSNNKDLLTDISVYKDLVSHRDFLAKEVNVGNLELYLNLIISIITAMGTTILKLLSG